MRKDYEEDIKQGPVGNKNLFINSECDMEYIKWTQEYNILKNKNFGIDIDNDGAEEKFIVGMDSPNGTKVDIIKNNMGYNLMYDTYIYKGGILKKE